MGVRKIVLYIILFSFVFLLFQCTKNSKTDSKQNKSDSFYEKSSGFDYARFPLIKPFEIIALIKNEWQLQSSIKPKTIDMINEPNHIEGIAYCKGKFYIYSNGETIVRGQKVNEAWYIVNINDSVINGFSDKNQFIQQIGKNDTLIWNNPIDLYKQFDETKILPWISGSVL
jgi:hypothetical protein